MLYYPGYDSGTEFNNRFWTTFPATVALAVVIKSARIVNEDDEGYIHIHRGIHGVGDPIELVHDWCIPVLKLEITLCISQLF